MKLQIVETKDGSGDWIYVRRGKDDGTYEDITALSFDNGLRTREQAIERAREVMRFYLENNGPERVLQEIEIDHK